MNPLRVSKRQFLLTTAAATAAVCAWNPVASAAQVPPPNRRRLNLNGAWQVAREGTEEWLPATVPGCIHTDLLAVGRIPDPFYRDNEKEVQWVGEATWVYRRRFQVTADLLTRQRVLLRCEGLDTLAVLKLNGREIGRTDNMFRTWEFDVRTSLQLGENLLEISFASPLPYMRERQAQRVLYEWAGEHEPRGRAWLRKQPCNFGWDWGPVLITCGVWRDIRLEAFDDARLGEVLVLQDHSATGRVGLDVAVTAETLRPIPLTAVVRLSYQGRTVASAKVPLAAGTGRASLVVKRPKLWWPAGLGDPSLYDLRVELLDERGHLLDRADKRIGLRTLKLIEADKNTPLQFEVNGVRFFSKGANYIPADAFANRVTPEALRRLVADAVAVNMNSLRFWGGGYYEDEALFDACDEMGVCVWLDFKFACSSYPAFDGAFLENVRLEARDQLRRLRHHACVALWCGNNEIGLMTKDQWSDKSMGRADYEKLFKETLGREVRELAPQANYVSGSPDCGDTHYWEVWHGGKPFEAYRTLTGFMSEFGFQSFPGPKTVRACTAEEDRSSVMTPVMQWHQRSSGNGNEKIRAMIPRYFNPPKDFESALWLSQILQGYGIKLGAEYWRQTMPRSMGCVFWQYNDCWPVASWSSVDYYGRWKALHYMARRFYAPVLVSGLEDAKAQTVEVFVTSDRLEPCRATLSWEVTDPAGKSLSRGSTPLEVPPQASRKVRTLELRPLVQQRGADDLLVWLKLEVGGQTVSDNLVTLGPPKTLKLADPRLTAVVARKGNGFRVSLAAEQPALWAWLELEGVDATFSDNFVHLPAGGRRQILVQPGRSLTKSEFSRALRVRSLYDTYAPITAAPSAKPL